MANNNDEKWSISGAIVSCYKTRRQIAKPVFCRVEQHCERDPAQSHKHTCS